MMARCRESKLRRLDKPETEGVRTISTMVYKRTTKDRIAVKFPEIVLYQSNLDEDGWMYGCIRQSVGLRELENFQTMMSPNSLQRKKRSKIS